MKTPGAHWFPITLDESENHGRPCPQHVNRLPARGHHVSAPAEELLRWALKRGGTGFAQDVSHELRTPLTVLDARLQLLQRRAGAGHEFAEELDTLRRNSTQLARVIDDLLSTVDAGTEQEAHGSTDLDDLAAETVRELGVLAGPRGVELRHVASEEPLPVPLAEVAVRRILTGLIENATEYTPSGGMVTVTTRRSGSTVQLTVTDTGSGISGIEPHRIFDRHAHGAAGQTGTPRSTGIGLSLAREMVVRAGGTIGVLATGATGTSLRVGLPLHRQA